MGRKRGHRGRPRRAGRRGLGADQARTWRRETYRLYVLDEFTYPMTWGWVDVDEVVDVLRDRPGPPARGHHRAERARPTLVDAADLVIEMTKVKHPMDAGQKGQRGIEW